MTITNRIFHDAQRGDGEARDCIIERMSMDERFNALPHITQLLILSKARCAVSDAMDEMEFGDEQYSGAWLLTQKWADALIDGIESHYHEMELEEM